MGGPRQVPFPEQSEKEEQSGIEQDEPIQPVGHWQTPLLQVPPLAQEGLQVTSAIENLLER